MTNRRISERIRAARKFRGWSQSQLAKAIGLSLRAVQRYEAGETIPKTPVLAAIARVLNINEKWLITGEGEMLKKLEQDLDKIPVLYVPLLNQVPAGPPYIPGDDMIEDYIPVPSIVSDPEIFGLRVVGDSMHPRIRNGDVVVISPNSEVISGDIAVVRINGEITVKQVKIADNSIILLPANPSYDPIVAQPSEVEIVGKVVLVISKP